MCYPQWPNNEAVFIYYFVFVTVGLLTPLCVAAVMYTCIAKSVRANSRRHSHTYSGHRRRENRFLFNTMLCTVSIFALLTLPYAVFLTVYMAMIAYDIEVFVLNINLMTSLNYVICTLSATNSCVNPLIYAKRGLNRLFRVTNSKKSSLSRNQTARASVSSERHQLISRWVHNINNNSMDEHLKEDIL